jgi:hypothetical protein
MIMINCFQQNQLQLIIPVICELMTILCYTLTQLLATMLLFERLWWIWQECFWNPRLVWPSASCTWYNISHNWWCRWSFDHEHRKWNFQSSLTPMGIEYVYCLCILGTWKLILINMLGLLKISHSRCLSSTSFVCVTCNIIMVISCH